MIENWIDELAKVWEINDGQISVHSYQLVTKREFPASIDPVSLDKSPIALTIPGSIAPEYSEGGPKIGFWTGVTEFHVAPDVVKNRMPDLMPWYKRILVAAAGHMKLNGKVELFLIDKDSGIIGPISMQYGDEEWHWGFNVHWTVKERLEGQFTVSR